LKELRVLRLFSPTGTETADAVRRLTLRISREDGNVKTIVRIDGRLVGEGAEELRKACASPRSPLVIDLSYLQGADPAGIRALRSLRAAGASLEGADVYIEHLLAREGNGSVPRS
jgi:hypothetical protein